MSESTFSTEFHELPSNHSFRELVLERQQKWKSAKKKPLKILSQSVDLPESMSGKVLDSVLNHMPPYVPEEVIEEIRVTHPEPILTVSALIDKRFFSGVDELRPEYPVPSIVTSDEDKQAFWRGVTLCTEIATDTLAQDILAEFSKSSDSSVAEKFFGGLVKAGKMTRFPRMLEYRKGIRKIEEVAAESDEYGAFRQELIIALLSGDKGKLNSMLESYGFDDFDQFAIAMGKDAQYSQAGNALQKLMGPRVAASIGVGGYVHDAFPGVINIPLSHTAQAMGSAGISAWFITMAENAAQAQDIPRLVLTLGWAGITGWTSIGMSGMVPQAVIHETTHYLSANTERLGFIPLKYK